MKGVNKAISANVKVLSLNNNKFVREKLKTYYKGELHKWIAINQTFGVRKG